MREKREFAVRSRVRDTDLPNKTVFLVFEGAKTEDIYFTALNDKRVDLGINPLIQLIPLVRCYGEEGWSNPEKIAKRIETMLKEQTSGNITYETLVIDLLEHLVEEKLIGDFHGIITTTNKRLRSICEEILHVELTDEVDDVEARTTEILHALNFQADIVNIAKNMESIISSLKFMYYPELDTICLICDRDKESFVVNENVNQYQTVLDICERNNLKLCVTNPCFEFWLLLHFVDCKSIDEKMLAENPCVERTSSHRTTFTERELKIRMPSYNKNSYDALSLMDKVNVAIKHEKAFCEDVEKLNNNIGSNIGQFISQLMI